MKINIKTIFFILSLVCVATLLLFKKNNSSVAVFSTVSSHSLPMSLLENSLPEKTIVRGVASEQKNTEAKKTDKENQNLEKESEQESSYSLNDPNLYEGDRSGVSELEVFSAIQDRLNAPVN